MIITARFESSVSGYLLVFVLSGTVGHCTFVVGFWHTVGPLYKRHVCTPSVERNRLSFLTQ